LVQYRSGAWAGVIAGPRTVPATLMEAMMPTLRPLCALAALLLSTAPGATDAPGGPRYTAEGALLPPADYREWVYLSSGLDMSYVEGASMQGHSMFDNVFVEPAAWAGFKQSGHWPDRTMFVLEIRAASAEGSILKQGLYQTDGLMGLEMHVRDEARFAGGWGFFTLDGTAPATVLPHTERCYACHEAHGAVDTTFTQFYPTARPIAVKAGTFRAD
jgi:hypothetical protein